MVIYFEGIVVLAAAVIWLILVILLKKKYNKSNIYILFFTVFFIYLCNVLDYTQFPIHISEDMRRFIGQNVWRDANFIPFSSIIRAPKPALLNILLTLPFGFGLPFIKKVNFKQIAFLGVALGFTLETLQLIVALILGFTLRYVNIDDVLCNFLGVVIGYDIFNVFIFGFKYTIHKFDIKLNLFLKYIYELH